ncbi:hypothetical protein L596_024900 [Steinernema carpocapsae]|uniref:Uncharacterized protein n=1 Tax=Steinernema carpocapsae TaxID=34508 RepID=A0A4U5M664_STECR|nr:hypothetical protein L596_024900 [Steinernema carpocapsae]
MLGFRNDPRKSNHKPRMEGIQKGREIATRNRNEEDRSHRNKKEVDFVPYYSRLLQLKSVLKDSMGIVALTLSTSCLLDGQTRPICLEIGQVMDVELHKGNKAMMRYSSWTTLADN